MAEDFHVGRVYQVGPRGKCYTLQRIDVARDPSLLEVPLPDPEIYFDTCLICTGGLCRADAECDACPSTIVLSGRRNTMTYHGPSRCFGQSMSVYFNDWSFTFPAPLVESFHVNGCYWSVDIASPEWVLAGDAVTSNRASPVWIRWRSARVSCFRYNQTDQLWLAEWSADVHAGDYNDGFGQPDFCWRFTVNRGEPRYEARAHHECPHETQALYNVSPNSDNWTHEYGECLLR